MPTPEQEQIASLVASQVLKAVKQVLIEERSLLISSLTKEVNSHLSATLKSYFEEQLAIQKQEFQSELQTKIDELKFQHYQQLERLGQAVEEVMSSQSDGEFSGEILDDYEEDGDLELDQFTSLEVASEFLTEDALEPDAIKPKPSEIFDEVIETSPNEMSPFLRALPRKGYEGNDLDINPTLEATELENSAKNSNDISIPEEPVLVDDFDEFSTQVEEDEEYNQFESELFGDYEPSQSEQEIEDIVLDPELNLFAETISNEELEAQKEFSLDPFADLSLEDEEFDESPEIVYEGEEYEFALEDLSLNLDSTEDPNLPENEELNEFNELFGDNESEAISLDSLESKSSEISLTIDFTGDLNSNQELAPSALNQEELILNSEFEQLEHNIRIEAEDLDLNDELNLFAESVALDYPSDDLKIVSEPNLDYEPWQTSDPFAELSFDLENEETENAEVAKIDQTIEEIIYEGEEYEYYPELDLSRELEQEFEFGTESNDNGGTQTEVNRLNLDLEQELNLSEIGDADLSEFADLEAENGFWNSDLKIENPEITSKELWHLGIDFGYSGIRACLFNQTTEQVYPLAFDGAEQIIANIGLQTDLHSEAIALQGFKQFLRLGIPYQIGNEWQPKLKWTHNLSLSLFDFQVAAQQLFSQISNSDLSDHIDIANILKNLETVILGHPHSWSDAYIFNLREAVLESGLVSNIEQILVIDQAITFGMRSAASIFPSVKSEESLSKESSHLFLDSGAFTTTLGFTTGSERRFSDLEYAGIGINQDIVLQLLFPKTKDKFPATKFIKSGEPNPVHRTELQQHLLNSPIGIESLAIAEQIKLFFSEQPNIQGWQGNVGGKFLKVSRSELEIKVIQPFIQSLNDGIDQLIVGTNPEDITEIAIAGGTTKLPSIHQWLEAKFANAEITILPSSNLAQGLAIAPLYSQYLDINRHQYSDFFLLSEICALNLQEPLNLGNLMKKLQNRGVNAKACSDRLANILLGQLPAGILPWQEPEKFLFLADPNLHPHLLDANLFTPLGNDLYDSNPTSTQLLGAYLKMLESSINQSFSEPLVFPSFATERILEVIT